MKKTIALVFFVVLLLSSCTRKKESKGENSQSHKISLIQSEKEETSHSPSSEPWKSNPSSDKGPVSSPDSGSTGQSSTRQEEKKNYSYRLLNQLPRIDIESSSPEDFSFVTLPNRENKPDYTKCKISISDCEEEYRLTKVDGGVKVRGNYTANYEKKPLRIKFDKKQKMLGLNDDLKAKSWVLLADYKDGSMLRNVLSLYLGNCLLTNDSYYCSDYQPVHVRINGKDWGMYLLVEQQQVGKGRIAIDDVDDREKGYDGTDIGYFFEYDGYYTEEKEDPTFYITYENQASYLTRDGKKVTPTQLGFTIKSTINSIKQTAFLKNYMEKLYTLSYEAIIHHNYREFKADHKELQDSSIKDSEELISRYIDIPSLVDIYLLQEISADADISWSSFFLSLDMSDTGSRKLTFQAPWDYDSAFGIKKDVLETGQGMYAANCSNPWLSLFLKEDWFYKKVQDRFLQLNKAGVFENSLKLIDDYTRKYQPDYEKNFTRWPNQRPYKNASCKDELREEQSYFHTQEESAQFLKTWYQARIQYLFSRFKKAGENLRDGNEYLEREAEKGRTKTTFEAEEADRKNGGRVDENEKASGKKYVGYFSGNKGILLDFFFFSNQKEKYLSLRLSRKEKDKDLNYFYDIYVNGTKLILPYIEIQGAEKNFDWHNWIEIDVGFIKLEQGENQIRLETKYSGTNLDCLYLYE